MRHKLKPQYNEEFFVWNKQDNVMSSNIECTNGETNCRVALCVCFGDWLGNKAQLDIFYDNIIEVCEDCNNW